MSYVERTDEEIIQAWEQQFERYPYPDEIYLLPDGLTRRQIIEKIKNGVHPCRVALVNNLREIAQAQNRDPLELIIGAKRN